MSRKHAEVIGGGIAGLAVAAGLAQTGWSVRLHERLDEIRALGAGIYIWDNGLAALEALGAFSAATVDAHIASAIEACTGRGRVLYRIGVNGPGQPRCYTLLRNRLISSLRDAAAGAGAELVTGSTCVSAGPDGAVTFADGTATRADLVVAADGVHSRIRETLGLTAHRVQLRHGAARLMVPVDTRPESKPRIMSHREHFRGTRRLLYTPCTPDSTYLALVAGVDDPSLASGRIDRSAWMSSFPAMAEHLSATPDTEIAWSGFELVQLTAWSRGKIALVGDAAHAQPPYLGQGGGTAMMNAVALAQAVRSTSDLSAALADWEREQRPGIERTQLTSYRMRTLDAIPDGIRSPLLAVAARLPGLTSHQLSATRLRA